ncbi:BRO family protein [Endozoicomonas sp.]|uniref:BRO family protein n=1 Tax=Endozoicomonas sp. TaxID=1892382 RepID=UPI003AF79D31
MNELVYFEHPKYGLVYVAIMSLQTGELCYEAVSVIQALGFINPDRTLNELCMGRTRFLNNDRRVIVIPESDVLRLVSHSTSQYAELFGRWLLEDVKQHVQASIRQQLLF